MWPALSRRAFITVALLILAVNAFPASYVASEGLAAPENEAAAQSEAVDVALDPGHSTWDVGATGAGLAEYQLTLDVANRVRIRLEEWGYTVRLTRTDHNRLAPVVPRDLIEATRVEQEARIAAAGAAAIYVSIHFNAHPNQSLRGTETYFNGDNHRTESVALGTLIQTELLGALRDVGYTAVDRGVKEDLTAGKPYGHFFSLRGPFPSVLVESLFLSNPGEAALLRQDYVLDAVAEGIARGIAGYFAGGAAAQEVEA